MGGGETNRERNREGKEKKKRLPVCGFETETAVTHSKSDQSPSSSSSSHHHYRLLLQATPNSNNSNSNNNSQLHNIHSHLPSFLALFPLCRWCSIRIRYILEHPHATATAACNIISRGTERTSKSFQSKSDVRHFFLSFERERERVYFPSLSSPSDTDFISAVREISYQHRIRSRRRRRAPVKKKGLFVRCAEAAESKDDADLNISHTFRRESGLRSRPMPL